MDKFVGAAFGAALGAAFGPAFATGGYITAGIGIAIFPWKLLESASTYIFAWLIGYSALLGPIAGIMIADYYLIRRQTLSVDEVDGSWVAVSKRDGDISDFAHA